MRLLRQAVGGGGRLLYQRGVLLGHLVQLRQRAVDADDVLVLRTAGALDFGHRVRGLVDGVHHLLHRQHGLASQTGADAHLLGRCINQRFDLPRSLCAAVGQAAHLAGNDRETPAALAGVGGLDRRVQRQEIGLERNGVNYAGDVGNLVRAAGNVLHGGQHLRADAAALARHADGLRCQRFGALRGVGRLLHLARDLLQRGRGLLQASRGVVGALRQVGIAVGNV